MIETYININTNEEVIIQEKTISLSHKLLIIILIFLSLHFASRLDINIHKKLIKYNPNNYYEDEGLVNYNRYYINNYVPYVRGLDFFNITHATYDFSLKQNMVRMEFNLEFYDQNEKLMTPSDFALYKGLQVICTFEIDQSTIIYSYPQTVENRYYQCIEYFDINEKFTIGIKLYQTFDYVRAYQIIFFTDVKFNYNNFYYQNENLFDPIYVNKQYINLAKKINENKASDNPKLKSTYLQYPYCTLKRKAVKNYDKWFFRNIYNDHFCFCIGTGCLINIDQNCKQYFLLSVIDKNQHLYKKTDFLFVDFIFQEYATDDTYPVFSEMMKQNYPVHYLTENLGIRETYCNGTYQCEPILYVNRGNYTINGDFVEKYFTLFLKLKAVVCSRQLNFFSNVFYSTDYIQYILIGHSIFYFKYFSEENDPIDKRRFDKLILPPSEKIIILAKSYGWRDDDILQINFPRWDKFNNLIKTNNTYSNITKTTKVTEPINGVDKNLINNNGTNNISNSNNSIIEQIINTTIPIKEEKAIFMMFAWRGILKNCEISNHYFDNISQILQNEKLNEVLEKEDVKIYFTIHGLVINKYRSTYKSVLYYNKNIKFVEQNEIGNIIAKSELIISDFSSLMFDFVYMRKPYICYVPDISEPQIEVRYKREYYEFYEKIKNGKIKIENMVYNVDELVDKVIYYINNNFTLEDNVKNFYDSFGIKAGNNVDAFINYLINLN